MKVDKGACVVLVSALLTLASLSFVFCPTAHAGGAVPVAAPAAADDDGDGDELLEHWNDPAFAGEDKRQLAGLAVLLSGASVLSARRRRKLTSARLPATVK